MTNHVRMGIYAITSGSYDELIERAKSYARRSGKSVSQIVSDYLEVLPDPSRQPARPLTPIVCRSPPA